MHVKVSVNSPPFLQILATFIQTQGHRFPAFFIKMARDGPGFLNGDQDADLASEISRLVGFEMYAVEDEKKEERVKDLNNHKLDVVFEYLYKVYKDGKSPFGGDERPLVLFSLMAMQLGATFEKEHLGLLREAARQLPTVYEQLMALTAVDEYKNNGTPWILESPLEIDRGSITDGNFIDWWEKPDGLG